ncbi:CUB domain-containing protein [Hymenobacter sp. 15J16-1T3B]|uniref:CUB domain-containing protein n=1 Tax=Hymenobacter sp. 15J16-1T3B TaxID=2886941 RepID=UPI001D11E3A5|nr:CUB domain-containing protein [Hymenobacter sp. 15J16-1T3B]MCC3157068.1 CUB domain-containing protein [Hymenobacter sp. 15J16-1T3B]
MKTCLLTCLPAVLLGLAAGSARAQTTYAVPAGTSSATITTCNGLITNTSSGGLYPPDQNATIIIYPATPGAKVTITIPSTYIEGGYDFLTVYNGNSASAPSLGTFTGTVAGTFTSTSADGSLTLTFFSDSIVQYPGWSATVACTLPPPRVGIGTTAPTQALEVAGQVFSNAGGFRFPDNTVQTTAAAAQQLSITGSTISLSGGGSVTVPSSADNLGNHTATQNLRLNANWLSGDGGNEGVRIDNAGNVGVGVAAPSARLDVSASAGTPALRLSAGPLVLSVASAVASTAASTLTVTSAVHYFTDNAAAGANGTLTLGWTGPLEGQTLLLGNFDSQGLPVAHATGTTTVAPNAIARFIFLNGGWRPM